jgi:hypothetical protein
MTIKDYMDGKLEGKVVYLNTFNGKQEVTSMRVLGQDLWAVCGKDNGGFGMSYMVGADTKLV